MVIGFGFLHWQARKTSGPYALLLNDELVPNKLRAFQKWVTDNTLDLNNTFRSPVLEAKAQPTR